MRYPVTWELQGTFMSSIWSATQSPEAKFRIGQVVRHRLFPFRGVIFDVDAEFSNTDEWWQSIPEQSRPRKDQPFYHVFAENESSHYVAYVSQQNLLEDETGDPVMHPDIPDYLEEVDDGIYVLHETYKN
jgi:heat shock protein HspQ